MNVFERPGLQVHFRDPVFHGPVIRGLEFSSSGLFNEEYVSLQVSPKNTVADSDCVGGMQTESPWSAPRRVKGHKLVRTKLAQNVCGQPKRLGDGG